MEKNGAEAVDENGESEQLEHACLQVITNKYPSKYRIQKKELVNCGNYQPCRIFLKEKIVIKVIMDCRTTTSVEFRTRIGFNQHDPIMTKEQSVLTKIMRVFSNEKILV